MARKSRSKQRSKGAGTRSGSAGGKSQGGGRSSAGKGKSQGGSGKSSSKGKSSKGPSKSTKKSTKSPSARTKRTSPPAKAPAPKKKLTAVQQRFKDREAKGLSGLTGGEKGKGAAGKPGSTIAKYRARQKQQVQNAALGRQATALTGIPSGKNLPAGSFGISEAGRAQAEANRTEAREKKISAMSPRNQALARQAYAKYGTINPTFSDTFGATSGDLRNPLNAANYPAAMGAGYTDSVVGGLNFAKNLIPGVKQLPDIPTLPAYNDARLQNLRNISSFAIPGAQLTSSLSNLGRLNSIRGLASPKLMRTLHGTDKNAARSILGSLKNPKNIGSTFREAPGMLGKGAYQSRFGNIATSYQGGLRGTAFGAKDGVNIQAIVPRGARTLGGATVTSGKQLDRGVSIASGVLSGKYTGPKAMQIKSMLNAPAPKSGGVLSGGAATTGLTGASALATKATKAGGLNIGGVDSGDVNDPTARVSGFRSVRPLGIAREALQGFGDVLTGQQTDFDQLGRLGFGATTDKLKDAAANMRINEVTDTLKKSPIRQAAVGFDYGIDVPDAIKQVDETRSVLNKTFKDFEGKNIDLGNIKPGSLDKNVKAEDLRGGISNTLYNLDRMPTLARGLSAFNEETDGGGDKELRKDLRFTFNRKVNAPTGVPGRDLMKATTPGIVNRVLSGKLKDMGQEAITQNNLTGGMTADKFDTIASTLNKNLQTEGTIAKTRKDELTALAERFGPGGGQAPTPESILRGVNPFRGSNRGGAPMATPRFRSGGQATTTPVGQLPQVPNPAQVELPVIPQQQEQQGLDPNTLVGIQNQSYQDTFNNLMAQFRPRNMSKKRNFRTSFNRDYFSQFV